MVVKGIDMGAALLWLLRSKSGPAWCVLLLVYPLTQWLEQPLLQTVPGAACQSWRLLEEFPLLSCLPCRAIRTWKSGLRLRPRIFESFWCLGVACGVVLVSGRVRCLGHKVVTCSTGGFGRISVFSTLL